jgi:hypothetical protein
MKLKKVTLEKTDTCLTYVLKRMGQNFDLCTYDTFHENFNQYSFRRKINSIKVGDILLWDKDIEYVWLPWQIDERGIEHKAVPVGFHFGIYEGDGYFSDCTRLMRAPHPSLRFRKLTDLKKNPDWILRLDSEKNEK